ncbi:MAG TPA: DUF1549 domain-containing protein [Verrucomicrobiales bacterium]|nr:DUF1549 domain-containing protein [Verrucomicrobiales bacterium]HIL69067.1 DUF1549 domain-containing protein [Verrucomicrobiota bacterium]
MDREEGLVYIHTKLIACRGGVHYGDRHGYDKDQLRHNACPYPNYFIRSFNQNTPYGRFVQPGSPWGKSRMALS